jgi:hypothetical protein
MFIFRIFAFIVLFSNLQAQSTLPSPQSFLRLYGEQYSPEYRVSEYLNLLSKSSDRILIRPYGESWEGRKLQLLIISSPENIRTLDDIRLTNLYNIGLETHSPANPVSKAIVWLSFGVHGNEAGASESVPEIVYRLLNDTDPEIKEWLRNTVVIIDPNLNPDGNSRYTHWINGISGKRPHPSISDREHFEPWPSGRYNHYIFDLNRDWAWQTQKETKERVKVYNEWMPHVHADFHEMGYNANYYFAPAAEPFHKYISSFQRSFQTDIGKNHARYFDAKGLLYWTRERFDLFYPSYGDTYPTYNGAVGMTYEQAGNSRSGRSIILNNGDTLTLRQKIDNNTIIALSTIEVASKKHEELIRNFNQYFNQSKSNPPGKYMTYVLKKSGAALRMADLLKKSGLEIGFSTVNQKMNAYHYQSRSTKAFEISQGDIVIQADQPRAVLLQVLMDESPELADSLTYDITAWCLPFAFDADCYAFTSKVNIKTDSESAVQQIIPCEGRQYAYVIKWGDVDAIKALSAVIGAGFRVRYAQKDIKFEALTVNRGDIIITRGDNPKKQNFDDELKTLTSGISYMGCLSSGMSVNGGDVGGEAFQLMKKPTVLTVCGQGTDPTAVGEIWHYFDNVIDYPLSIIEKKDFFNIELSTYNTIVLPGGWYAFTTEETDKLSDWVKSGGKLIVLEDAISLLSQKEGFGLEPFATDDEKSQAEKEEQEERLKYRTYPYDSFERRFISNGTAGSIIKNQVDNSHPLGFSMGQYYYSLKTSPSVYHLQKHFHNVIFVPKEYDSYGFVGAGLKMKIKESVTLASAKYGKGQIICFVDNPLFRGFWDKGLLLFGNAVFF